MRRALQGKDILITAGPTWVPIDNVRVISNIATGSTGILLAEKLRDTGAKVTLVLGPTELNCLDKKIKLIRFKFFDELKNVIIKELKSRKYDIMIHSAAVSDYRPLRIYNQKIKSGIKGLRLNLVPTAKIIDLIKKINKSIYLVGFKFEPGVSKDMLTKKAKSLMNRANLDLVVANTIDGHRYKAYIMDKNKTYGPFSNKRDLTENLVKLMGKNL